MPLSSFSQNLTPVIKTINLDTMLCFTHQQNKIIVKKIKGAIFCDSIVNTQRKTIEYWEALDETKEQINQTQQKQMLIMNQINKNHNQEIGLLNNTVGIQRKKIRRGKRDKVLLSIGLVVVSSLALIN